MEATASHWGAEGKGKRVCNGKDNEEGRWGGGRIVEDYFLRGKGEGMTDCLKEMEEGR